MIQFKRTYNRMFLNDVRQALEDYKMIQNGDRVAVGLSGGKDSITLLFILSILKRYSHMKFDLIGINIDLGLGMNTSILEDFCNENDIEIIIEKTNIGEVIFEDRREKNPCSLCSKLRKGALYRVAKREGINVVALGHSSDDAIETFLMNMLCVGKLASFLPCAEYEGKDIRVVRPMVYLREEVIKKIVQSEGLPVIESPCPVAGKTKREDMKNLLLHIQSIFPDANEKIITSFQNIEFNRVWKQRQGR